MSLILKIFNRDSGELRDVELPEILEELASFIGGGGSIPSVPVVRTPSKVVKSNAKISSNLDFKIFRDNLNDSELFANQDNYAGSVELKYFDIHAPKNARGSRQPYMK